MVPETRVMLWSAPRCLSSVFERSVRELSGVEVFHEPLQRAFYEQERRTEFDLDSELQSKHPSKSYDSIEGMLVADYSDCDAVFVKDLAYYIPPDRFKNYIEGEISNYHHTFLIRSPRLTVPSHWRVCVKNGLSFPGIDTEVHRKLYDFFELIHSTTNQVIVIDAVDLLSNPEAYMKQYCRKTGLPYNIKMLSWTPGIVEDWTGCDFYMDWHWSAMYSSGFSMGISKQDEKDFPVMKDFPPEVEEEIKKNMPYYEVMYKHRMNLP